MPGRSRRLAFSAMILANPIISDCSLVVSAGRRSTATLGGSTATLRGLVATLCGSTVTLGGLAVTLGGLAATLGGSAATLGGSSTATSGGSTGAVLVSGRGVGVISM